MLLLGGNHGVTDENWEKLKLLVTYVFQACFPVYFKIKVNHLIVEAPQHIVTHLRLMRQQSQLVHQALNRHIINGAWFTHSKSLLLSLLVFASSDQDERCFAVDVILKLRGNS